MRRVSCCEDNAHPKLFAFDRRGAFAPCFEKKVNFWLSESINGAKMQSIAQNRPFFGLNVSRMDQSCLQFLGE